MRYRRLALALVVLIGAGAWVFAPFSADWRLTDPDGDLHRVGAIFAAETRGLFLIVLALTALGFVGVEAALVWSRVRASRRTGADGPTARHWDGWGVEAVWSIVPAAILASIALSQSDAWASLKFRPTAPRVPVLAELTGEGSRWIIKYPGPDGEFNTADDLLAVNELHVVKDQTTRIHLRSADEPHSFFLPRLRIKRDAKPGEKVPVWFAFNSAGRFEMVCAAGRGWGHYNMRGEVVVHETEEEFQNWLAQLGQRQVAAASDGREENHP